MTNLTEITKQYPGCNVYSYGSWTYGTQNEKSDLDFIVVGDNVSTESQIHSWGDLHLFSTSDFIQKIKEHEISALECLFLPEKLKQEYFKIEFTLNLEVLRHSISQKSSNSWVKAKKKLEVEKELYIAQKSLFHSLRILTFGIELAQTGKITNYNQSQLWKMVLDCPPEKWSSLKPLYNSLKSKFKEVCPK